MHRLYKDSTRFFKGKHVKDLSRLNRDLRKVIIVDDDEVAFVFQPDNGIKIKKFVDPKDKSDRSLDNLKKFLIAIIMEGVQDVPAVLRQFKGMDADQIYEAYQVCVLLAGHNFYFFPLSLQVFYINVFFFVYHLSVKTRGCLSIFYKVLSTFISFF